MSMARGEALGQLNFEMDPGRNMAKFSGSWVYPLVNIQKAIENDH